MKYYENNFNDVESEGVDYHAFQNLATSVISAHALINKLGT